MKFHQIFLQTYTGEFLENSVHIKILMYIKFIVIENGNFSIFKKFVGKVLINYYMILLVVFSMVALGEVFKLKKEVRKLNKITDFLLKNSQEKSK